MQENRGTRVVLAVLLVAAIALITISYRGGASGGGTAGNSLFGPVEHITGNVTRPVAGFFHAATRDDSAEIANLQQENDALRAEVSSLQVAAGDRSQLSRLGQLAARGGYQVVPASVIAAGGDYSDTVTIDAGTRQGIAANETVLNGDGLVGVVTSAGPATSTVQLSTDASATTGVRMAGAGTIGEVSGTGATMADDGLLRLRLFSASAVLTPGEQVVTFGSVGGRPYVPGVPVGTVREVTSQPGALTQTALIKPFVDFTGLGVLGVVAAPPRVNPGDAVLSGHPGKKGGPAKKGAPAKKTAVAKKARP
jgi:rod shape-determining protein MreC